MAPRSTVAPVLDGAWFVTGYGYSTGGLRLARGKVEFIAADLTLRFRGLLTTRRDDGSESVRSLVGEGTFEVDADGTLRVVVEGVTTATGFVTSDGEVGSLLLALPGASLNLLIARCPLAEATFAAGVYVGAEVAQDGEALTGTVGQHLVSFGEDGTAVRLKLQSVRQRVFVPGIEAPSELPRIGNDRIHVHPSGLCTDEDGRQVGYLSHRGVFLTIPGLPADGSDDAGDPGAETLGFGLYLPADTFLSGASAGGGRRVVASGHSVAEDGAPSRENVVQSNWTACPSRWPGPSPSRRST
jgi:hypothetical protein